MSGFLKYLATLSVCIGLLTWASGCCFGVADELAPLSIEFIILDQAGENVLVSNTLPANVIWCYREGVKAEAMNPYPDYGRGVFVMEVMSRNNYEIDVINQSFVQLDLSYSKQNEQCGSYERISGVTINGVPWDYHANPVLTFVYNP